MPERKFYKTRDSVADTVRNPPTGSPVNPPVALPSDYALSLAIEHAIRSDGRLAGAAILVRVSDGVVEIKGTVDLEFQRILTEQHLAAIKGVLAVENHLEVRETGPMRYPSQAAVQANKTSRDGNNPERKKPIHRQGKLDVPPLANPKK